MTGPGFGLGAIVLDCADPRSLAAFYGSLLGRSVTTGGQDGWVDLEGSPTLAFQRVQDYVPPTWPDGAPQQFHLDLTIDEFDATHDRVVALGATPLDPVEPPAPGDTRTFRVYADPAGHPFCLCRC
ncbi:MAG: VOC family protein [Nocardioidaceae bacterium]